MAKSRKQPANDNAKPLTPMEVAQRSAQPKRGEISRLFGVQCVGAPEAQRYVAVEVVTIDGVEVSREALCQVDEGPYAGKKCVGEATLCLNDHVRKFQAGENEDRKIADREAAG